MCEKKSKTKTCEEISISLTISKIQQLEKIPNSSRLTDKIFIYLSLKVVDRDVCIVCCGR